MTPEAQDIIRSTRDAEQLRASFEGWLRDRTGDPAASVGELRTPGASGMSSETLLVDAAWDDGAGRTEHALVARVAPDEVDVPIFPTYDLDAQFRAMRLVGQRSAVPVPATRWLEPEPSVLGAPFVVMDRIEGRVPPDNLPYTFEGWLVEASPDQRRHLQDASVRVLADVHGIDLDAAAADGVDLAFLERTTAGDGATPLRRHVDTWRRYYDWLRGDVRYPLLDAAFAWIEDHWPDDEGEAVLSWGDARIGNAIFDPDTFDPVAVLDWEMVGLGPRGLDLGWLSFLHTFFQDIAEALGLPGLPGFLAIDDIAETYQEAAGVSVGDLDFYIVYAAVRHGCIMARVDQRRVHFGESEAPATPDDAIMHGERLAALIGHDLHGSSER